MSQQSALYTPENARAINYLRLVALITTNPNDSRRAARHREAARLAKILGRDLTADTSNPAELRRWGSGFLPQRTVDRQFESTGLGWQASQARQQISVADC